MKFNRSRNTYGNNKSFNTNFYSNSAINQNTSKNK